MDETNLAEWKKMNEELESLDANREKIIKELREVQKLSKAAIYSLQRGSFEDARTKLATAERLALSYLPLITQFQVLRKGTFSSAIEEFVEARAFEFFLLHGKLIPMADLGGIPDPEEYLGGIADLCGEMTRYAVLRATVRDKAAVQKCARLADDILHNFMQFNLKNGMLRKKSDSIKYAVKRFEEILYDLSLISSSRPLDAEAFSENKRSRPDAGDGGGDNQ